jgi:hypothetical protein
MRAPRGFSLKCITNPHRKCLVSNNGPTLQNVNCDSNALQTDQTDQKHRQNATLGKKVRFILLSEAAGLALRLEKCKHITLADGALHVPDDLSGDVIDELDAN